MQRPVDPATLCAHARERTAPGPPPLIAPIYQTSVWRLESLEQCEALNTGAAPGYIYTRDGHPNHTDLEELIAGLEGAPAALVDEFRKYYGPTMNAFEAAEKNGRAADLQKELEELFNRQNQNPRKEATSIPATFLRVTVAV